jgi:hypothetical protein
MNDLILLYIFSHLLYLKPKGAVVVSMTIVPPLPPPAPSPVASEPSTLIIPVKKKRTSQEVKM